MVVVGTRPEAIKMAPVHRALKQRSEVDVQLTLTGQHTDMVDAVLDRFRLRPDHDLGIMREGQSLYDVAHGCLEGLRGIVRESGPDMLLVQGDTATVFFASLVGFFERVQVGHVEAGLRSGDKAAPFPEEVLRRLTDVVADLHFAPTAGARDHLLREGLPDSGIFVTGNTVVDALLEITASDDLPTHPELSEAVRARAAGTGSSPLILLTAHRRESFGEPIRGVFGAVRELADRLERARIVYPVHPNPNVRGPAEELLGDHPRITLTEPVDYLELARMLSAADLVLTDSGGIQEEAPTFGVPVLVLRKVTERPEGVEAGVARLVGTDPRAIVDGALEALAERASRPRRMSPNPYGDGLAGERIADIVVSHLTGEPRRTRDWQGP